MQRIKLTKNFSLDEYIPKELYLQYFRLKPHFLFGMLDVRLVQADQKLRDYFGACTINNWFTGGDRQWSGIRTPESSYYKPLSQHSYGRASDKLFNVTAEEVRIYIRKNWRELGYTCIEKDTSWTHSDVRWWNQDFLLEV